MQTFAFSADFRAELELQVAQDLLDEPVDVFRKQRLVLRLKRDFESHALRLKDITAEMSEQYNVPVGVYVAQVVAGSGADEAGIEVDDVITSFNGRTVTSVNTLNNIMKYLPAGTTVEVTVAKASNNYEEETVEVTLTHKVDAIQ